MNEKERQNHFFFFRLIWYITSRAAIITEFRSGSPREVENKGESISIIGGAITTAGSGAMMFACQMGYSFSRWAYSLVPRYFSALFTRYSQGLFMSLLSFSDSCIRRREIPIQRSNLLIFYCSTTVIPTSDHVPEKNSLYMCL